MAENIDHRISQAGIGFKNEPACENQKLSI